MTPRLRSLLPYAVFLLSPLLVFPPAMFRAGLMDGQDDKLSNLPLLLHSGRKLLAGEIFWSTDLWMGMPLLAEPEAATFYLPRLLLLLFPPAVGYAFYILLHFVGAQVSAYLYLRQLGLWRGPASFGAVAYAFTGFMLGHLGHTMFVVAGAWAPLFLFFTHRAMIGEGRTRWSLLGAALAFGGCFFAGAVQLSVYLLALAGVLHLAMSVLTRSWRPFAAYAAAATAGLLLVAPQLLVSLDHARTLAVATRHDYAFATDLSFPPLLSPTLVLPIRPRAHGELYSRVGLSVFVAAVAGALGSTRKSPVVRAWLIVLALAFVLMLGRFFPPLARALHAVPGLDVLRGPARHNFELGLAAAVLAAFGAQELLAAPSRRSWAWPAAATLGGLASVAVLLVCRAGWIHVEHGSMLTEVSSAGLRVIVVVTLVAVVAGFVLRGFAGGRHARFLPAALALLALGEARAVEELDAESFWDGLTRRGVPRESPAPVGSLTRIIPPDIREGGYATLPGNAVLYFPGLQSMLGYASIAPSDAVTTFDLDMHGHARHLDDVLWSRLPEVYGVTHVVMPEVVCGVPRAGMDPALPIDAACEQGEGGQLLLRDEERRCALHLGAGAVRYRVDAEVRSDAALGAPLVLGVWSWADPSRADASRAASVSISPAEIGRTFAHVSAPLDLTGFRHEAWLGAYTDGGVPVEVRAMRLSAWRLSPLAELVPDAPVVLTRGQPLERRLSFPPDGSANRLEVVARRISGEPRLVVDIYDDAGFDPDAAQLMVERDLSDRPRLFGADFALSSHPSSVLLRAFVEGEGDVEVVSARWLAETRSTIASVEQGADLRPKACALEGDVLTLRGPDSGGIVRVELPVRPVVLSAELSLARDENHGVVGVGVAESASAYSDANETVFPPGRLTGTTRIQRGVALPADATTGFLRVYSQGPGAIDVRSLTADDGCLLARYAPERRLDDGWWLYRALHPLPRVFAVGSVISVGSIEEARDELRASRELDPRTTALAELDGAAPPAGLRAGSVDSVRFIDDAVELTASSEGGPTFVVVNDHYDPRFVATVDGAPAPLFRTNAMVRGLFVPAGRHRVSLRYEPPVAFFAGVGLAILGIALAGWLLPRLLDRLPAVARKVVTLG